jgi:hypothetical protein
MRTWFDAVRDLGLPSGESFDLDLGVATFWQR